MNVACLNRHLQPMIRLVLTLSVVCAGSPALAQAGPKQKTDPLLTEEDINLIKVYEVDLETDPPPRVVIAREELRDFVKEFQNDDPDLRGKANQEDFLRSKGHIQLAKIFDHRARDYYKHVSIRSQIKSLREFGNIHRNYVLEYFQPTFANGEIPELFLFARTRGLNAQRLQMTNFYILTQSSVDGKLLIDRNEPQDSLLVQWALPREEAKFPAPDGLEKWRPRFRDIKDKRCKALISWIQSLRTGNQGFNYGVSYTPPKHQKPRND